MEQRFVFLIQGGSYQVGPKNGHPLVFPSYSVITFSILGRFQLSLHHWKEHRNAHLLTYRTLHKQYWEEHQALLKKSPVFQIMKAMVAFVAFETQNSYLTQGGEGCRSVLLRNFFSSLFSLTHNRGKHGKFDFFHPQKCHFFMSVFPIFLN